MTSKLHARSHERYDSISGRIPAALLAETANCQSRVIDRLMPVGARPYRFEHLGGSTHCSAEYRLYGDRRLGCKLLQREAIEISKVYDVVTLKDRRRGDAFDLDTFNRPIGAIETLRFCGLKMYPASVRFADIACEHFSTVQERHIRDLKSPWIPSRARNYYAWRHQAIQRLRELDRLIEVCNALREGDADRGLRLLKRYWLL